MTIFHLLTAKLMNIKETLIPLELQDSGKFFSEYLKHYKDDVLLPCVCVCVRACVRAWCVTQSSKRKSTEDVFSS